MLNKIRSKFVRSFLATAVVLMMLGTPIVAPVYADCSTSNCSAT